MAKAMQNEAYEDDTEKIEYQRMLWALDLFGFRITPEVRDYILKAYNAKDWEWIDSDGCTFVDEVYWPSCYFPPCVSHDFACIKAAKAPLRRIADRMRSEGDRLFYEANIAFGVEPLKARIRYFGVRFFWLALGRWRIRA